MQKLLIPAALFLALTMAASTPTMNAQSKKVDKAAAGLTFEIYKDSGGDYRFRLKDGDTILASSGKGYDSKEEVKKVVDAIKTGASKATVVDNSEPAKGKGKGKDK